MNTHVDFEIAKLLKEKGFYVLVNNYFSDNGREEHSQIKEKANYNSPTSVGLTHSRPTISDVVMWLYEKYGIWITPLPITKNKWYWEIIHRYEEKKGWSCMNDSNEHNSPTDAYVEAIKHTLKNLIIITKTK